MYFQSRAFVLLLVMVWMSVLLSLTGCSSVMDTTSRVTNQVSERVANTMKPYRITVVQGNVVTKEQYSVLRPGMSRLQIRDILGTPLLTSVFHTDRWDYVFTYQKQGQPTQSRRVTLYFKGETLERFETNEDLPSEGEFAGLLEGNQKAAKPPVLELSEDRLKKMPSVKRAPEPEPVTGGSIPTNYPPLESPSR
jgi:outer membrane protein assembly factor BamE